MIFLEKHLRPGSALGVGLLMLLFAPAAVAQPMAPVITGTHSGSLVIDADGDGLPSPGDTIEYTIEIQNSGFEDATNVAINMSLDPNSRYVEGSLNTSPFAAFDEQSVLSDNFSPIVGNLLTNDAGRDPGETFTVSEVQGSTVPGQITGFYGRLTWQADGTYSYELDPMNPILGMLPPMSLLFDNFNYTCSDGSGTSDSFLQIVIIGAPTL